ncbi:protein disabled [Trichonephila inaurata madagascariensis]|uniref:Protein disabled n=1 Tax=Trichonephila inaurata madagascariensis TaxID=2747483 RepID=A0A8X6XT85_9ARAC|nr:protein disabled [Trichonephila inaurata madagascariensis]
MQDKEAVDDAEEALTCKTDIISDRHPTPEKKDSSEGRKESSKDGKFAFRKMKTPKKEKPDKNSPSKYEGDGVIFKAKLIGFESVPDARGDKMCQDAMQRLKSNVKNIGPHKKKINICVSLQGIKIKDEKTGAVMYHHPVSLISFISQDISDARAFGYVFGSTNEPHQFIAIKTEKPAFHVVLALRDLFQTVLNHKQEEIQNVKEQTSEEPKDDKTNSLEKKEEKEIKAEEPAKVAEESKPKDENIYFEVLLTEPRQVPEEEVLSDKKEPVTTVDDLLGLQTEMDKLKEGINQMDTSIAAAAAFNTEIPLPENDPFDTSFVLGPKRDSFPLPMPTPIPIPASTSATENNFADLAGSSGDKYAVFNAIDSAPSVFETPEANGAEQTVTDIKELEEEIAKKTAPPKPPRLSKSPDLSLFADLDPLGKDRPYKDKTEFFQDVKNPPKKVLNDLVDPNKEPNFPVVLPSVPFPVDFESNPSFINSPPFPNTPSKMNVPMAYSLNGNGDKTPKPFEAAENNYYVALSNGLESKYTSGIAGVVPHMNGSSPNVNQQQLTVNCTTANLNMQQNNMTSSPIPIPSNHTGLVKERAFSNGSIGSPYSKSPLHYNAESPNNSDYYIPNYNNSEGNSPTGLKNGENGLISPNTNNNLTKHNINSFLNSTTNNNTHNGVSRPRPRPSLNKGGSIPNGGRTVSSHSLSSDSSSDYEVISRENMQSIANVLLTNGHRLRAQSLCLESNNEFKLKLPGEKNIFAKKHDPFADDFFFSLPKKNGHLTSAEIPEYV